MNSFLSFMSYINIHSPTVLVKYGRMRRLPSSEVRSAWSGRPPHRILWPHKPLLRTQRTPRRESSASLGVSVPFIYNVISCAVQKKHKLHMNWHLTLLLGIKLAPINLELEQNNLIISIYWLSTAHQAWHPRPFHPWVSTQAQSSCSES
jgi:hypothetical protein